LITKRLEEVEARRKEAIKQSRTNQQKRKALGSKTIGSKASSSRPVWKDSSSSAAPSSSSPPGPLPPQVLLPAKKKFASTLKESKRNFNQVEQSGESVQSKDALGYLYSPDTATPGVGFSADGFYSNGMNPIPQLPPYPFIFRIDITHFN
jgi:hypothetical protein